MGVQNVVTTTEREAVLAGLGQVYGSVTAYLLIGRNNIVNIMPIVLIMPQTKKAI